MAQETITINGVNLGIVEKISARQWYWLSAINGDRNYAASRSAAISSLRLRNRPEQAVDHSAAQMVPTVRDTDGFLKPLA